MTEHIHFRKEKLSADIQQYGWSIMLMPPTDYLPSFAYTVGLWQNYRHPEVIMFGLPIDVMQVVLNSAGDMVKNGVKLSPTNEYEDFFERCVARFIGVDARNTPDYFGVALEHYNDDLFPALQLVWADSQNMFPWQETFDEKLKLLQPLLDRNASFKFYEEEHLGVFTTRQWLENRQTILRVVHDADGDWQFLTGDQQPDDIRLVCLKDIIDSDSSLNQLFDLDLGMAAVRTSANTSWTRESCGDH